PFGDEEGEARRRRRPRFAVGEGEEGARLRHPHRQRRRTARAARGVTVRANPEIGTTSMASANPIVRFFAFRVRLWPLLLAVVLIAGALATAFTSGALNALALPTLLGGNTVRESSEVVRFVVPEQQVVLASAHIQGLESES